jgi:hypothetical protein
MPPKAKRHGNFPHQLVIAGRVSGGWRRAVGTRRIEVDVLPYRPLTRAERQSLDLAIESYARFMGLPATLRVLS